MSISMCFGNLYNGIDNRVKDPQHISTEAKIQWNSYSYQDGSRLLAPMYTTYHNPIIHTLYHNLSPHTDTYTHTVNG